MGTNATVFVKEETLDQWTNDLKNFSQKASSAIVRHVLEEADPLKLKLKFKNYKGKFKEHQSIFNKGLFFSEDELANLNGKKLAKFDYKCSFLLLIGDKIWASAGKLIYIMETVFIFILSFIIIFFIYYFYLFIIYL